MEDVRCACTSSAVAGEEGVETLMISRLVVAGVMPKRRKDSAIYYRMSGSNTRKDLERGAEAGQR